MDVGLDDMMDYEATDSFVVTDVPQLAVGVMSARQRNTRYS